VVGSSSERSILEQVCDPAGLSREEAEMDSLIRRIAGCDLLVCLDSGPMHLAQTLGIPVVALFGPGDFDLWRPKGRCDQALFHRLPCNPCLQNECVRPADSCMPRITVDEVFDAIQRVLSCKQEGCGL
jgi:ADP-heptose:LPS heptosyltransferase